MYGIRNKKHQLFPFIPQDVESPSTLLAKKEMMFLSELVTLNKRLSWETYLKHNMIVLLQSLTH